jgi:hypothetical protein
MNIMRRENKYPYPSVAESTKFPHKEMEANINAKTLVSTVLSKTIKALKFLRQIFLNNLRRNQRIKMLLPQALLDT